MLDKQDMAVRERAAFQLDALRQAIALAEREPFHNRRLPFVLYSLRMHHAQLKSAHQFKKALWVKMLVVDITFEGTVRKVLGGLKREMGQINPTPVSNTGVNLGGYEVSYREGK